MYYNYLPDPESGEVSASLTSMEKAVSIKGLKFYSSYSSITGAYTAYVSHSSAKFTESFAVGDSIVISGCTEDKNNTVSIQSRKDSAAENAIVSAVVDSLTDTRINLLLYDRNGEKVQFANKTESGEITREGCNPHMNCICVHNNRLWGTASSGEYIYASKLGDCTNFNSFAGLGSDSWYSQVATGGNLRASAATAPRLLPSE